MELINQYFKSNDKKKVRPNTRPLFTLMALRAIIKLKNVNSTTTI